MRRRIYTLSFLLIFFASLSCSPPGVENASSLSPNPDSFAGDAGDACFDAQMETWMVKFNQHQQEGLDMHTADAKARMEAKAAYEDCRNRNNDVMASDQARKD
jgi:hypothetical protein